MDSMGWEAGTATVDHVVSVVARCKASTEMQARGTGLGAVPELGLCVPFVEPTVSSRVEEEAQAAPEARCPRHRGERRLRVVRSGSGAGGRG